MFLSAQQHWAKLFSDNTLGKARALFPHTHQGKIYLNHAATAPLSTRVVEAMTSYLRERSVGVIETYEKDVLKFEACRKHVAALINAGSPDRIALTMNTSDAIGIVASGLSWKSGDRILLHEAEFPANVWPFLDQKRHGIEIDVIPQHKGHPTTQLIADAITDRTKLVALSAVQFLTGFRADLEAIGSLCRKRNIVFAVDGAQAVGAIALDVQKMNIDAMAAGCQKWQMGPHGTGWLYLTEELQSRIHPAYVGWLAVEDPWSFSNFHQPLASSARRYEGGSKNAPGLWGMEAALSTLLEFGTEAIDNQILALTQKLLTGLQAIDGIRIITPNAHNQRAGIVTVELHQSLNAHNVFRQLADRDITISLREGKLRYAPHFYNSATEIALAVSATREAIEKTITTNQRGITHYNITPT